MKCISQLGFLRKRTDVQHLLIVKNDIHYNLLRNAQVDTVYIDFHKMFDNITHNELFWKLKVLWYCGETFRSGFKLISSIDEK